MRSSPALRFARHQAAPPSAQELAFAKQDAAEVQAEMQAAVAQLTQVRHQTLSWPATEFRPLICRRSSLVMGYTIVLMTAS